MDFAEGVDCLMNTVYAGVAIMILGCILLIALMFFIAAKILKLINKLDDKLDSK